VRLPSWRWRSRSSATRPRDRIGAALVWLRWAIVVGWALIAVAAVTLLPPLQTDPDLKGFASDDNPAVGVELRSFELFGFPLSSRTSIVQRDPDGLSVYAQAEALLRGAALTQGAYDTPLLGALPVPNTLGAFPGSAESGTTVLTYVFADPDSSFGAQRRAAERFAEEHLTDPDDAYVGVTGSVPARNAQYHVIQDHLHDVELATIIAVALIVGLTFRSVVAPVLALATVGVAVAVTLGVGGLASSALGIAVPPDLRPLVVALLLGVVTDYCILFLSGLRHQLAAEGRSRRAAQQATSDFAPIVAVAGVTVAAGTGALVIARSPLFSGAGPALALTVVIGLLVSVTLVPAAMAIIGRWTFWPSRPVLEPPEAALAHNASAVTRLVTQRRSAAVTAAACIVVLVLASLPLLSLRLGLGFIQSLPEDEPVSRAAQQAQAGFATGILSPTELLLEGPGVGGQLEALEDLGDALQRQPGVAAVLGPGDLPPFLRQFDVLTTADGGAARYLVVLDSSPLGAEAVAHLRELRRSMPSLLREAGLGGAAADFGGDTAVADAVVEQTTDDLLRITVAAVSVNLLMLLLFLRALVAPLYLLACSVLALCAALGLTTLLFQGLLDHDGLTFYVPFTAAVLLVSLGSDYNIFAVGHIWQVAKRRPLREALLVAIPQSTRAITSAGMALAASFGLLAVVPLASFRELAFVMAVGILLDVFVVRALLVPSLMTLVGRYSGWPSRRLMVEEEPSPPIVADAAPAVR
jgi:RND superfamily putative drug exporter